MNAKIIQLSNNLLKDTSIRLTSGLNTCHYKTV